MFVIAHRGDSVHAPENTLAAAKAAIDCGADGIEFDVHPSADGNYVVCHDETINRTSNGSGRIGDLLYKQMIRYDFGLWFGQKFKGEKLPLVTEYLQTVESMKIINMEIKELKTENNQKKYETLYKIIDGFKFYERFILSSFDEEALRVMGGFDKRIKTAFLFNERREGIKMIKIARELGCSALHPHIHHVNERFMGEAKAAGFDINAWTVDSESGILKCARFGCNAVITNNPSFALETLKKK